MVSSVAVVVLTLSLFAIIAEAATTFGTGADGLLPTNEIPPLMAGPTGTAVVTIEKIPSMPLYNVYFLLTQSGLTNITASHIHSGNSVTIGPVVIAFTPVINFTMFEMDGIISGVVQAPANISNAIIKSPSDYYVNVHTAAEPGGAMRAQMSNVMMTRVGVPYHLYVESLTTKADNVTLAASGSSTISLYTLPSNASYVGFAISAANVTDLTAAHIHEGGVGVSGNVVVAFTPAINFTEFNTTGFATGNVDVDPMVLANIAANPTGYYVNVHSATYPNGVMRGQLSVKDSKASSPSMAPASSPMSTAPRSPPSAPPAFKSSASMVRKPSLTTLFVGGVVTVMALATSLV